MSCFGHQQAAEIHPYVRVAGWPREQIVTDGYRSGRACFPNPGIPGLVAVRATGGEREIEEPLVP